MRVLKVIVLFITIMVVGVLIFFNPLAFSTANDIQWVYRYPFRYQDVYIREGAVCGDIVLISPVSVSSKGEFYPFTLALDVDSGDVLWTATVGGHVMCDNEGIYLLDDYLQKLRYLSYWGKVENERYIDITRGRWFAKTHYGLAVLQKDGILTLIGSGLSGGISFQTGYPPVENGILVSSGDVLFWKTKVDNDTAIVAFDIPNSKIKWVRKLNIHKSYMVPYDKYLFVSGFEKLYVISVASGDIARSYNVSYYEPYVIISGDKLLIPRKDWLDLFSTNNGLLVRVYKDSDMVFSAYSIAGNRVINIDSDNGRAYACSITSKLSCVDRKMWVFTDDMIMGDRVYGTGLNFVIPVKDGWLVFLTYRVVPTRYINGFEIIKLIDKGVSPRGDWETPFGGADGNAMP